LKKHGCKTLIGCVQLLCDSKFLKQTAAYAAAAGVVGGPVLAALTTAGLVAGKLYIHLAQRQIELIEGRSNDHSEIAVIYKAKKLVR